MNNLKRATITRLLTGFTLLFLLLRFFENATPSGMHGPPLFQTDLDITYWVYWLLDIPSLVFYNKAGALGFDLLIAACGIGVLFFPLRLIWVRLFSMLLIVYAIGFNSFALIHTVTVDGLIIVFLPFWIRDGQKFGLAWQGIRYFCCYLYFGAFCWKAFIGNALRYWPQGTGTFRMNLVRYLYEYPHTITAKIYRSFLQNEWALNAGHLFVMLLEASMVIGFFTKKADRFLIWIPVVICILTYFFADVFIFELLVLNFAFLTPGQLALAGEKFPILIHLDRYAQKASAKNIPSA